MIRFWFINEDGDPEEFTERVNLDDSAVVLTSQAEQGSTGTSTITIDDPLGDWTIRGHRWVYVLEDSADFEMLYWGYAWTREVSREGPNVLQSRKWVMTVNDINTLLQRRIMVGSDCNRPAETDVERLQWLTGTTEQSFIDDPSTFLDTSGPVDMDAADYRYQYATQIYDDCSQASGKNWYLYPYFATTWKVGFWYAQGDSTDYSSDIRISNYQPDIDYSTTFEAKIDTTLTRDPSRVYSGVSMPFDGGTQYSQRASTISVFAARDTSAPMVNVKTYTKAQARALRYLDTIKTEEDVIETGLYLPPEQVNDVLAGHRIEARFTHLPGYEDFSWMRVLKKTSTFLTPWLYEVDLTLSAEVSPPAPANFLVAFFANTSGLPEDLSDNPWTLAYWSDNFTNASVIACGAGPPQSQAMGIYYRAILPGETTTVGTFKAQAGAVQGVWCYEVAGCDMSGISVVGTGNEFAGVGATKSVSGTASVASVLFGGIAWGKVDYDSGWCAGGLYSSEIVSDVAGTEVVNKSSLNDCTGSSPWMWIGHQTGTGSVTVSASANAHGAGSGAYNCGWNIGKAGLLIPAPGSFSP